MVVITTAVNNWIDFDGWCLKHGIDPLVMPSRRFLAAVWMWLTENRDEDSMKEFWTNLDQAVYESQTKTRKTVQPTKKDEKDDKKGFVPLKPFQAPPGWTPPGWSDEKAYQNSVAGMMGVQNTGGGKIGGSVKKKS